MHQFTNDSTYNEIIEKFLIEFEKCWNTTLAECNISQNQLQIGSRLRPLIVLWGYLCGCHYENINKLSYELIANTSVSIELIHKASILLDDWIDKDTTRHGKPAFHTEHSTELTVMYSLYLVSLASKKLSMISDSSLEMATQLKCIYNIHNVIHSMSLGAVMELSLKKEELFDLEKINTIAELETAEIIANALQLGYLHGTQYNENVFNILHIIGIQCGYLFQALNDFEAFSNYAHNAQYKGCVNYDFDNGKKNIVVAMLYELVSIKDKEKFTHSSGADIALMAEKYNFKKFFMNDIKIVYDNLLENIETLGKYGVHQKWIAAFMDFINYAKKIAYTKL